MEEDREIKGEESLHSIDATLRQDIHTPYAVYHRRLELWEVTLIHVKCEHSDNDVHRQRKQQQKQFTL